MSSYGYSGPRGLSISELLLRGGEIESDAARRSGEMWGGIASNLGGLASKAITDYGEQKDAREVQHAVTAATTSQSVDPSTPNAGMESILAGLDPEQRKKAETGIYEVSQRAASVREQQAKLQKAQQDAEEQHQKLVQHSNDTWGSFATHLEPMLDSPDGGIALASAGLGALRDVPGAQHFAPFAQQAQQALAAATTPEAKQAVVAAWREQVTPLLQQGKALLSPDAQKTMAEMHKPVSLAEGATLVDPQTGKVVAQGPPKPETRSIDVQMAEASAKGDTATVNRLLALQRQDAAARRDPEAAAARVESRQNAQQARGDARLDHSYQFHATQIDKVAKPVEDAAENYAKLTDALDARTPAADALVAPALLKVVVGGAGSGVRITKGEIESVLGGRSNLEAIKARLEKWNPNSGEALSITDAQRAQMKSLAALIGQRAQAKVAALETARQALFDAQSPEDHRRVLLDLHRALGDAGAPAPAGGGVPSKVMSEAQFNALPSGTTFIAPDGSVRRKP